MPINFRNFLKYPFTKPCLFGDKGTGTGKSLLKEVLLIYDHEMGKTATHIITLERKSQADKFGTQSRISMIVETRLSCYQVQ